MGHIGECRSKEQKQKDLQGVLGWGLYSSRLWFLIQVTESNSNQLQEQAPTGFRYGGIHGLEDGLQDLTASGPLFALPFSLSASFAGKHVQGVALPLQAPMPEV